LKDEIKFQAFMLSHFSTDKTGVVVRNQKGIEMEHFSHRSSDISQLQDSPGQPKKSSKKATTVEYNGTMTPAQVRLPEDLLQALRLHAIKENTSVSKLVAQCCSTPRIIHKAHVRVMDAAG